MFLKPSPALATLLAMATPAAASGGLPSVPRIDDPSFQTEILGLHNAERRSLGIGDLAWSPALANEARDWANKLAQTGKMAHEKQSRHGENLSSAPMGQGSVASLVQRWLAEKPRYIPGSAHPNTSTSGNWMDVGHYTAVVWSATREAGCAVGRGQTIDFLVCRYNPPGNVRGYAAYDVNAARAAAAAAAKPPAPVTSGQAQPAPVPKPKPGNLRG
jgi:uncharacterized protein YkwD